MDEELRFEAAIKEAKRLNSAGYDMGLAISITANGHRVDQKKLGQRMQPRAVAKRKKNSREARETARKEAAEKARKARLAKWRAQDDQRYGWMNK